ncbi:energy transducer TonB [Flavobacterium suzhouense]|uniref:Energy transducer TonB n=1 Tax=Flavobacterium suzhouense TaxID=1529638 RepID=A0ABW5NQZ8_9FLAO
MSKISVFDHGWIDLVFEGRNQEYGAYQLRKQDPKTTMLALVTGIGLVVSLITIPSLINHFGRETSEVISCPMEPITPVELIEMPKVPEAPKPQPQEPASGGAASSEPTVAFTTPVAASDPTPVDLPTTDDVLNTNPGQTTGEGVKGGQVDGTSTAPGPGTGVGPGTGTNPEGTIETFVDVAPLYPGGLDAFYKDVARRFNSPELENVSTLKVLVSFVVEPDGTLSNIKATRDPGYGMGAEAVRVLKSLKGIWKPGMKGGKAVRTAYNLPITVKVN